MLAAAHRADKIAEVIPQALSRRTGLLLSSQKTLVRAGILAPERQIPFRPVEDNAHRVPIIPRDAGFMICNPMPNFERDHLLLTVVVELEGGVKRVRRFLVIIEHEMPAGSAYL